MDVRIAEAFLNIDLVVLGQRLKNARVAAGMNQAQVAGESASIAHVSRIESGQRRPDLKLLEGFAERVGVTLEDLLLSDTHEKSADLHLKLEYAELALRSGSPADAVTLAQEVLDDVPASDSSLRRDAHLMRALALEGTGAVDEATVALLDIVTKQTPDSQWLRAAIALTRCLRESGDPARATEFGNRAQAELERLGLSGLDESMQLAVTIAAAFFELGDATEATRRCERAIQAAARIDSPTAMASAYWNASLMESAQGRVNEAIPLARQAVALLSHGADTRNLARLYSELGCYQLRLDPPEVPAARESLERAALELDRSSARPVDRARNEFFLARAHYLEGEPERAAERARAVLDVVRAEAPLLAVDVLSLLGQLDAEAGRRADAHSWYLHAVQVLTDVGADRHAAQLWFELGSLLDQLGENEDARVAYRNAAASTGLSAPKRTRTQV